MSLMCIFYKLFLIFILMTNFFSLIVARNGMNRQGNTTSISCYHCHSAYDPRCGDPFDAYSIGIVNCSQRRPLTHIKEEPTLCRKTVQKIQGEVHVVRGCGYIRHDADDKECLRRTGTHDVVIYYCSCTSNLCNTGESHSYSWFYIVFELFMSLFPLILL